MFTEPNELFALLEQGGVGKSTTLQIFHRVTNPTSENAFLFNQSILTGMSEISASMDLWKDRNTMAGQLSGGMKRRLSIIVSTIGDPDVLILDEPTTGMNPAHRRYVWASLAQFKHGRSILLTAYSMEEADALSDKGAILIAGHLKAIGNTTRLKNEFRNGYRVEI
ncbi:P-loop containing nucleoside triphosphate hydrolase protein, partial [Gamsiella multidivaricata]|uniref:P-loop containing nucleoside triphosphate hydrolase protein n=1 Tax=Gamsiella multidivaricata TaxID=101098 RepID=UPI002220319D